MKNKTKLKMLLPLLMVFGFIALFPLTSSAAPPTFTAKTISSNQIEITLSENCTGSSAGAWDVSDNTVESVSDIEENTKIILTLANHYNDTGVKPTVTYDAAIGEIIGSDGESELPYSEAICTDGIPPTVNLSDTTIGYDKKITATFSEVLSSAPRVNIDLPGDGADINNQDMNGSGNVWKYTFTRNDIPPNTEGIAILTVQCTDDSGNVYAGDDSLEFTVDRVSPKAHISFSDEDGKFRAGDTVTITADFTEDMSDAADKTPNIKVTYTGEIPALGPSPMTRVSATQYTYELTVPDGIGTGTITLSTGVDISGNEVVPAPLSGESFTFDNTKPTVSVNKEATEISDSYINKTEWQDGFQVKATIEASATLYIVPFGTPRTIEGIEAAMIVSQPSAHPEETTITFAAESADITDGAGYAVYAVDEFGNVSEPEGPEKPDFTAYISALTATLDFNDDDGYVNSEKTLKITATFNHPIKNVNIPVLSISYTGGIEALNNVQMTKKGETLFDYSLDVPEGNGTGTITINSATDVAGNQMTNYTPADNTFTVDNTKPAATLSSKTIGKYGAEIIIRSNEIGKAYLVLQLEDDPDKTEENQFNPNDDYVSITADNVNTDIKIYDMDGGRRIKLYVIDRAGNVSEPSEGTVIVADDETALDLTFVDGDIDNVYYKENSDEIKFQVNKDGLRALAIVDEAGGYAAKILGGSHAENNFTDSEHFEYSEGVSFLKGEITESGKVEFTTHVALDSGELHSRDYRIEFGAYSGNVFIPFIHENYGELILDFKGRKGVDEERRAVRINFEFDVNHPLPAGVSGSVLKNAENIRAVPALTFTKAGVISVSFNSPTNLLSDEAAQQMPNLMTMEFNQGKISINSETLSFLANYGADIEMYGIEDFDRVLATADDGTVLDNSDLISDLAYDDETNTLSFTVNHFTTYQAQSQLAAPSKPSISGGVASWPAVAAENAGYAVQLYKNGSASGSPIAVGTGITSCNLTSAMNSAGSGSYTVRVTAKGTGLYYDSEQSVASDPYSHTVNSGDTGGNNPPESPEDDDPPSGGTAGGTPTGATGGTTGEQTEEITSGNAIESMVNGEPTLLALATTEEKDNTTITTIALDNDKIDELLESGNTGARITVSSDSESQVVVGTLNGETLKNMGEKSAVLEIKTGETSFILPADQIDMDEISKQFGADAANLEVNVTIAAPSEDEVKIVESAANKGNYEILVPPVEFEITCTNGTSTVEVSKFSGYVERLVAIPDGVDPEKVTTGIVVNSDGTFSHVPTKIVQIDGKYYAQISSMTNSIYTVISSTRSFDDINNHWAKEDINDMGSRLIIDGDGKGSFHPNREITRAEFAAIVVRALGLLRNDAGAAVFSDVHNSKWYFSIVSIASEYKLIAGDGKVFRPDDKISREEAIVIVSRALSLAKADISVENPDYYLERFTDREAISGWAKESVAACVKNEITRGSNGRINPKDNITRAEAAAIIRRMLIIAGII